MNMMKDRSVMQPEDIFLTSEKHYFLSVVGTNTDTNTDHVTGF